MTTARNDLRGRTSECAALDRVVAGVRGGESQVLVVRGEAGIGKTVLLDYLCDQVSGWHIARAAGVESEMELAFAGLHQLCAPMLDRLDQLPHPQHDALATAFGLKSGDPPDRFLIALAVLGLLSEAADETPLLCVIDDAQWLDQASIQALAFVARRLRAESVAVVFAVRTPVGETLMADLDEIEVGGLSDGDARALLDTVLLGPVDDQVCRRIVAETNGNPLALLELPRGLTPSELAGGFGRPDSRPMASRIEQGYMRQLQSIPANARRLMLTAAAEPLGDVMLLWRAAELLDIDADAAAAVSQSGLVQFGSQVQFRHPLVRSAAYRAASPGERRDVHRALAEVTDPVLDPDRRAWHQAHGTAQPNEPIAAELERSAGGAHARGGVVAAAAFLERSVMLTPDPTRRADRALDAAKAKRDAGSMDAALALLAIAEAGPPDERRTASAEVLQGQIAFDHRQYVISNQLLLSAARRLAPIDPALARATHLDALAAAVWVSGPDGHDGMAKNCAEAALLAPAPPDPPRAVDLVLDALAIRVTTGFSAAAPALLLALESVRALADGPDEKGRWLSLESLGASGMIPSDLGDFESWFELAARQVEVARDTGALIQLQMALNYLAVTHLLAGDLESAAELVDEDDRIARATGNPAVGYAGLYLTVWRGDPDAAEVIGAIREQAEADEQFMMVSVADYLRSVLANGSGRYDVATSVAWQSLQPDELGRGNLAVGELAEAASRTKVTESLDATLQWISERASAMPTDWTLGLEARVRALTSDGDAAESSYLQSIEHFGRTRLRVELSRSHLLFGEWLRRKGRRVDARAHLRTAHDMLSSMGIDAFAERAMRELLATGESVRKRSAGSEGDLTPQEQQISLLAAGGATNPEIGAKLFISSRTVEWHLRKVFTKLGVTSRKDLGSRLERVPGL